MRILIFVACILFHFGGACQDSTKIARDSVFAMETIQYLPEYPGGMQALYTFLGATVLYPKECIDKDIQGKVFVEFVVNEIGKVTRVNIKRGAHKLLDEEAMRVVRLMPDWKPGINNGKPVKCRYLLPVNFKITDKRQDDGKKKKKKRE